MKKTFIVNIFTIVVLIFILGFSGCKGEGTDEINDGKIESLNQNGKTFKFKDRLFSVPSPFLILDLIKNSNTKYNPELLNPPSKVENYSSNEKKTLNLGVYTADMAYANIYEQHANTIKYIKVTKSLSSNLHIMNSNSIDVISEIEEKIGNTDSLNKIFANAFRETDLYLTDNDRSGAAILVLTGAWVEGLYLMTQTAMVNKNQLLLNRIGEQKYSINNLLMLMSQTQIGKNEFHNNLLSKLNDLKSSFDLIEIKYTYDKHIILPNEKKTIVISETKITITDDILNDITKKTEYIRNSIIK